MMLSETQVAAIISVLAECSGKQLWQVHCPNPEGTSYALISELRSVCLLQAQLLNQHVKMSTSKGKRQPVSVSSGVYCLMSP